MRETSRGSAWKRCSCHDAGRQNPEVLSPHRSVRLAKWSPSQTAYELGLWDLDNPPPISYHSVGKQIKRLEKALGATWTGTDDTVRDLEWLCHTLIAATIPRKHRKKITAVSMDSKIIESWAVSKIYVKEKDALAEHRLKERERIDMTEPTLPTVTGPITNKIGEPAPTGGSSAAMTLMPDSDTKPPPTEKKPTSCSDTTCISLHRSLR